MRLTGTELDGPESKSKGAPNASLLVEREDLLDERRDDLRVEASRGEETLVFSLTTSVVAERDVKGLGAATDVSRPVGDSCLGTMEEAGEWMESGVVDV